MLGLRAQTGLATIIPNPNYGGAGGFTRGLLHLKDNGFSHCLFMDDDASCEVESIYRTYRLLEFAKDEKLSVAAMLLLNHNLYEAYDIGHLVRYDSTKEDGPNIDLRLKSSTLTAASLKDYIHMGPWWHFAFKIDQVQCYPFPFFVKGDDSVFSAANNFQIVSLSGISVWSDDPASKDNIVSKYLVCRARLMLHMYLQMSKKRNLRHAYGLILQSLLSFDYGGAQAQLQGLEDFMNGPTFWTENLDMSKVFPKLRELSEQSKEADLSHVLRSMTLVEPRNTLGKRSLKKAIIKSLSKITLNGHVLPKFLLSRGSIVFRRRHTASRTEIFGHHTTVHIFDEPNIGFVRQMDRTRFYRLYLTLIRRMIVLAFDYKRICADYEQAMPKIMTEEFWRGVYNLPKNPEH